MAQTLELMAPKLCRMLLIPVHSQAGSPKFGDRGSFKDGAADMSPTCYLTELSKVARAGLRIAAAPAACCTP